MTISKKLFGLLAVSALVMLASADAYAAAAGGGGAAAGTTFNVIAQNIVSSISNLPGFLSAISYIFGILLGTLGILKIKDHVENPGNTPLKDGAIRLAAGGGLLALPIIYNAMQTTIGTGQQGQQAQLNAISMQTAGGGAAP